MPGATTARLVVCSFEMPMKLFMMPHTVPNRPTKGAVAPMVARMLVPRSIRRPTPASMRSNRAAMRSLMPSTSRRSGERRSSLSTAEIKRATCGLACARGLRSLGERARRLEHGVGAGEPAPRAEQLE